MKKKYLKVRFFIMIQDKSCMYPLTIKNKLELVLWQWKQSRSAQRVYIVGMKREKKG